MFWETGYKCISNLLDAIPIQYDISNVGQSFGEVIPVTVFFFFIELSEGKGALVME